MIVLLLMEGSCISSEKNERKRFLIPSECPKTQEHGHYQPLSQCLFHFSASSSKILLLVGGKQCLKTARAKHLTQFLLYNYHSISFTD